MHRRPSSWRALVLGSLIVVAAGCAGGPAQWTYQPTPVSTPTATASGSPAQAGCSADATVVKIEETAALKMNPATASVTAGEKVCFEVTNTAGFAHDFYVGPTADVEARNYAALVGIPEFTSGTQQVAWTVPASGSFEYACLVAGHLEAGMKGTITIQ